MNAIRVAKRGRGGGFTYHWLLDPERTMCGRKPAELDVVEHLDVETLPGVEACHGCVRFADGWEKPVKSRADVKVTLQPSQGTLRTTGPLRHGLKGRGTRRL